MDRLHNDQSYFVRSGVAMMRRMFPGTEALGLGKAIWHTLSRQKEPVLYLGSGNNCGFAIHRCSNLAMLIYSCLLSLIRVRIIRAFSVALMRSSFLPHALLGRIPIPLQTVGLSSWSMPIILRSENKTIKSIFVSMLNNTAVTVSERNVYKLYYNNGGNTHTNRFERIYQVYEHIVKILSENGDNFLNLPSLAGLFMGEDAYKVVTGRVEGVVLRDEAKDVATGLKVSTLLHNAFAIYRSRCSDHSGLSIEEFVENLFCGINKSTSLYRTIRQRLIEPLLFLPDCQREICHGDFWTGNLIRTEKTIFVLDFDNMMLFPDWYDSFYIAFFAILRLCRAHFGRWFRPVDPAREAFNVLKGKRSDEIRGIVRAFQTHAAQHQISLEHIDLLEACYFRMRAIFWSISPVWHPKPELAIDHIATYADRLEKRRDKGILSRLILADWSSTKVEELC